MALYWSGGGRWLGISVCGGIPCLASVGWLVQVFSACSGGVVFSTASCPR